MRKTSCFIILILCCLLTPVLIKAQEIDHEVIFAEHKYLPGYKMKKLGNTHLFQGNTKRKAYFEGWYFKMVSDDGSSILSVIPGISISENGKEQHAFVQIIDGKTAQTYYYSYPIEEFSFSKKEFAVKIGPNYFSDNKLVLNINKDSAYVKGEINMAHHIRYTPRNNKTKGIMGWYRFVPFMQCYHGVVSLTHNLSGSLTMDNKTCNFENGHGYIEKDWGKSMPSSWIWMQTNSFNNSESSFMLSIANVPWLGNSFTGYLGFFYHNNEVHPFATYTKAKLNIKMLNENSVQIRISDKKNTFLINASRVNYGELKAPVNGSMDRRIVESVDAKLKLQVLDLRGKEIFSDSTNIAGLEIVGNIESLIKNKKKKRKAN
ncbi:MAG: hypothetical protein JXA77_06880 [Bacteroidales bacterium]|nr:hypothetical protein [Bacteroidales bacterium]MBN2819860.1 hypothetical protein [Bacteroidales bacterium]